MRNLCGEFFLFFSHVYPLFSLRTDEGTAVQLAIVINDYLVFFLFFL